MRVDKLLLFGGSFNPTHHGHLIVARYVAEHLGARRVVLVPSAVPPHKQDQPLAPAKHRLAMCKLAVAGEPRFEVSDCEIGRPGPSYTIDTVSFFRAQVGAMMEICWLVGMDSLSELGLWHRSAELVDQCTIVTAARPGAAPPSRADLAVHFRGDRIDKLLSQIVESPRIDIASTDIRARVRTGRSIRYLVPECVRAYVEEHGLYK
jgi:nicotinate-nucleotide adenylyltransferase